MTQSAKTLAQPMHGGAKRAATIRPFCGLIDPVLVEEPVLHALPGSISRDAVTAVWTWVTRDLRPDLIPAGAMADGGFGAAALEPSVPDILARIKAVLDQVDHDHEAMRRLRAQTGRENARAEIAVIASALRHRALLIKAQGFGRAINTITEESALGVALQSMPLQDPKLAALLFQAALGQVANPTRLITAAIRLSGNATEATIARNGFGPLIEAFIAHAQNQIHSLELGGPFADVDLACRSLDRYHRLMRALTGYIEFSRGSSTTQMLSTITKAVSDRIEPRLRDMLTDLNMAMRRPRDGADRVDNDAILAAINGMYLLSAVRDAKDSLALNAVFDQAWNQSAQALEIHVQRNLDLIRQNPADAGAGARLDAAIKMAQVRFNPEYAETLRRARQAAERRG